MNLAFPKKYFDQVGLVSMARTRPSQQTDRFTLGTAVIRNRTSGGVRGTK